MTEIESGQGIDTKHDTEEWGLSLGSKRALIPQETEAPPLVQVPKTLPRDVPKDDMHPLPIPKADHDALSPERAHGPGRASQGNPLAGHPGPHGFPMMKVGGQEQAGLGFEFFEFSSVLRPNSNGASIPTVDKAQEIKGGVGIEAKAEPETGPDPAPKGIFLKDGLFPPIYIKGENQRQGKEAKILDVKEGKKDHFRFRPNP